MTEFYSIPQYFGRGENIYEILKQIIVDNFRKNLMRI